MLSLPGLAGRFALLAAITIPCLSLATPPDWAPAHGWRKKNDARYAGYSGRSWDSDYGVQSGSCDRGRLGAVVGGVVGGAAGGVIGAEVGDGADADAAVVLGTVIGAAIGAEIGRRMDRTDRACVGHSLELAAAGQSVQWINPNTRITYRLQVADEPPLADGCRRFRLVAHGAFGLSEGRTTACPDESGVWSPAPDQRLGRR
jgi:surface antigen